MTGDAMDRKQEHYAVDEPTMARLLNISPRHLFSLRKLCKVPFIQLGRRIMYEPSHVFEALRKPVGSA